MKKTCPLIAAVILLGGCVYAQTPHGSYGILDLPASNHTTMHKTVTIHAPAGTTVHISETPPPTVIYREPPRRDCFIDVRHRRRVCR